jgi:hypothetical protein
VGAGDHEHLAVAHGAVAALDVGLGGIALASVYSSARKDGRSERSSNASKGEGVVLSSVGESGRVELMLPPSEKEARHAYARRQ